MTTSRIIYFFCFVIFFITPQVNSLAAPFEDPTKPADYIVQDATEPAIEELKLNGIWTTSKTRWAVINGLTVKTGDLLLNQIKIIAIHKDSVLIEENNNRRMLYLLTTPFKTH